MASAVDGAPEELGVDAGAAGLRTLEALEHQRARSRARDEEAFGRLRLHEIDQEWENEIARFVVRTMREICGPSPDEVCRAGSWPFELTIAPDFAATAEALAAAGALRMEMELLKEAAAAEELMLAGEAADVGELMPAAAVAAAAGKSPAPDHMQGTPGFSRGSFSSSTWSSASLTTYFNCSAYCLRNFASLGAMTA